MTVIDVPLFLFFERNKKKQNKQNTNMFVLWAYSNSDMPSQPAIASGFATMKLRPE